MLVIPSQKKIFVHIPRTGGNYLSEQICNLIPGCIRIRGKYTHMPIWDVRESFPDYEVFTIMRKPDEIFVSHFNFCKWILNNKERIPLPVVNYAHVCDTSSISAHINFLLNTSTLCRFGGFKYTYTDKFTTTFQYHSDTLEKDLSNYLETKIDLSNKDEYNYIDPISVFDVPLDIQTKILCYCYMDDL